MDYKGYKILYVETNKVERTYKFREDRGAIETIKEVNSTGEYFDGNHFEVYVNDDCYESFNKLNQAKAYIDSLVKEAD